ncbi:DUF1249 domain-containing protein [Gynuella sp.]|uniref:DUF1249 domain-containing protein n=1 Tax=Gynuella sp. TaxID=2969146 RepID=UPI003D12928F
MSSFRIPKKKYVPDLAHDGATCEGNYAKLQKIFPEMEENQQLELDLHDGRQRYARIRLKVRECFSYTATVQMEISSVMPMSKSILIRVYQDARMAEVVKGESGRQHNGVYPYPNEQMYQVDEKAQLNRFVSECLSQCLSDGHIVESAVLDRLFSQM